MNQGKRRWSLVLGAFLLGLLGFGTWATYPGWGDLLGFKYGGCSAVPVVAKSGGGRMVVDALVTHWTRSYQLYSQPHAIWLSRYEFVGVNLPVLEYTLTEASSQRRPPELVVYSIPDRDMGQSSAGGFRSFNDYMADNRLNAERIAAFVRQTGIAPRVYLEPDALGHAITYRRERSDDALSKTLYTQRTQALSQLVRIYAQAGARVYLDVAHSGWFDYSDADIEAMATALHTSGVAQAHGIVSNVSNRQPLGGGADTLNTENHYLKRLLAKLNHGKLDVVVDTSRNGKPPSYFVARQYSLKPNGLVLDNETPAGRRVGRWEKNPYGELWIRPLFGKAVMVSILTKLDKFAFNPTAMTLTAPPWLDPVGDVVLGRPPADSSSESHICRYRFIKPPDDCDGSINCPAGESRHDVNVETAKQQQ